MRRWIVLLIGLIAVAGCLLAALRIRNSDAYRAHRFYEEIRLGMTRDQLADIARRSSSALERLYRSRRYGTPEDDSVVMFGSYAVGLTLKRETDQSPANDRVVEKNICTFGNPGWLERVFFPTRVFAD
jgi:hypothetical protein